MAENSLSNQSAGGKIDAVLGLVLFGGAVLFLLLSLAGMFWYPGQLGAALLLLAFLPGYALLTALWPQTGEPSLTRLEKWLIAAPVSYGLTITLLLLLVFSRLPLNLFSVAVGLGGLTILFSLIARYFTHQSQSLPGAIGPRWVGLSGSTLHVSAKSQVIWFVVILGLAAFFRMANIHYSDHQGDEADILLRAVRLAYGDVEAILTHSKGPGEILLLNSVGALTGRFDEQTVRLPFALAGTVSIGLIVLLGQQLFNRPVGLVAGILAAIDGVFVSYARTAQYQSLVLLLTLAAIYSFYRFYQTGGQSRRWHGLGTFLLASAFLFHFETLLLLPVAGYLTIAHVKGKRAKGISYYLTRLPAQVWRFNYLWVSAFLFITLIAAFYGPFLLHPSLKQTGSYLENRIGGGSLPPFNNLAHFFYFEALKYNSVYYVALFNALLGLVGVIALTGRWRDRGAARKSQPASDSLPLRMAVVLLILLSIGLALTGQSRLAALMLGLSLALFFALVIFSRQTGFVHRLLGLWIAPPFLVYVFLVNRPGKHHYLFLAALVIWASWALVRGWQNRVAHWPRLTQPAGRWFFFGVSSLLLLIFAAHTIMVLLRSDLEYVLTYPAHKSSFYPTDAAYPYSTRIGFGYPFRLGWQVIGYLKRTGQLEGTWAGNDSGNAPNWYMLNTPPTPCYPQYVFRGEITYRGDDDFDVPFEPGNFGYVPRYRIWGNEQLRMTVLEFNPGAGPAEVIDLSETARFGQPVTLADFAATIPEPPGATPQIGLEPALILGEGSELKNNAPPEYMARAKELDGQVALLGYDVEENYAQADSILPITLYWQAQKLLNLRYKVFVHLVSASGELGAQADDFPGCGQTHTNTWTPGEVVLDRHLLKLPATLPPGDYRLLVGMYEPDLNLRLNYFDVAGNEQGNSLTVGTVTIRGN